jgi:hypothetical protein
MLTGRVPFSADTPIATMYRHVNEDPPPPSTFAPIPSELEDIVMRALEKDPKRRFASAAELEAALLAVPRPQGGDTMRLEPAAAETQPVGRVGVVAAGGAKTEPVAAAASGGGLRSRRSGPSHARPRRSRSRRPWLIAALVVALVLTLTGVLIAAMSDPLPRKPTVRRDAREAAQTTLPTATPEAPVTFADAWSGLISAIGSAKVAGDISDHAADELVKDADELLGAYRDGETDKLSESLQHLDEHLTKAVEEGEISATAADGVDKAISDVVVALQDEGVLAVVPTSAPTGPTGDEHGGEDQYGGSPPYGEANGHGED